MVMMMRTDIKNDFLCTWFLSSCTCVGLSLCIGSTDMVYILWSATEIATQYISVLCNVTVYRIQQVLTISTYASSHMVPFQMNFNFPAIRIKSFVAPLGSDNLKNSLIVKRIIYFQTIFPDLMILIFIF